MSNERSSYATSKNKEHAVALVVPVFFIHNSNIMHQIKYVNQIQKCNLDMNNPFLHCEFQLKVKQSKAKQSKAK